MTINKGVMYANLGILDHDRDLENQKSEKKAIFVSKNLLICLKPKIDWTSNGEIWTQSGCK